MLTVSEKEWLEQRDAIQFACGVYRVPGLKNGYDLTPDLADALEFSERVAAKLASRVGSCAYAAVPMSRHCMLTGCASCKLRDARLQVEEEMDA